ncbi:MAG: outer membrane lipoprotein carrier protein LolA [Spirochaetales bacterium]|nr:outer membrane lipoprotein carrier protein LolA [Spirochaetales bacterium]
MTRIKPATMALFLVCATIAAGAQEILTADSFLQQVGERYAAMSDYEGRLVITTERGTQEGTVLHKAPNLLRIDFSVPAGQVISYDGSTLLVYVPELRAILSQTVRAPEEGGAAGSAGVATAEGLRTLRRNYSAAYEKGPDPVELEGTGERVIRLILNRKTVAEGFRTIILSVSADTKLIRRIEGTTVANETLVFDFTAIKTDQGIAPSRFIYDAPNSANTYSNFLFKPEE